MQTRNNERAQKDARRQFRISVLFEVAETVGMETSAGY